MLIIMSLIGLVLTLIFGLLALLKTHDSINKAFSLEGREILEKKEDYDIMSLDIESIKKRMEHLPDNLEDSNKKNLSFLLEEEESFYSQYIGLGFTTGIYLTVSRIFSIISLPMQKGRTKYYLIPYKEIKFISQVAKDLRRKK